MKPQPAVTGKLTGIKVRIRTKYGIRFAIIGAAPLKGRGERVYPPHAMTDQPDSLMPPTLRRLDLSDKIR
jgi:hypothetical protein